MVRKRDRKGGLVDLYSSYILFSALLMLVFFGCVTSGLRAEEYREQGILYRVYNNDRFGYSIPYPAQLLVAQPPPENNDGRTFASADGSVQLIVYGSYNALGSTLAGEYDAALHQEGLSPTYQTIKDDWFVVSGYMDKRVMYRKTILENDTFYTFMIFYDASSKSVYDPITAHISGHFLIIGE